MEHRDSYSPMDFSWDNGEGPVDNTSAFVRPQKAPKRKFGDSAPVARTAQQSSQLTLGRHTGTHSVLESPSKSALGAFNTPNRLHLREPHNEHVLFSAQKPLTPIPSHLQNQVPRTPPSVIDVSSGGETPNTPAQDSDAATPDTQIADRMGRFNMGGEPQGKSPKKSRRESLGLAFKSLWASSPSPSKESRGSRKPYSTKAEHRVNKRRAKTAKAAMERGYDSDDMQDVQSIYSNRNALGPVSGVQPNPGFVAQAGGFFSWLEAHPHLPHVLSYWLQLALHMFFLLSVLAIAYFLYSSVKADIDIEASNYEAEVLRKITICAKEYRDNHCDPATRAPALMNACSNWQSCMDQDPKAVAKASVTARTFARILNAFVHEFSYKSMVGTFLFFCALINLIMFFRSIRLRWRHAPLHPDDHSPPHNSHPSHGVYHFVGVQPEREQPQSQPLAFEPVSPPQQTGANLLFRRD